MENQNEFQDQDWQERNGMPNQQENDNEGNVFSNAGAEDEDIGPVNETEHVLPEEEEGDNRFMDNEEEIDDPLAGDENIEEEGDIDEIDEPLEDDFAGEVDDDEEL